VTKCLKTQDTPNNSIPKLKHHLKSLYSGGTPETGNPEYWSNDETGIPWVAIGDMSGRELVNSTEKRITESGRQSRGLMILPRGTIIYSMYASLGHVAELGIDATINQALLGFDFKPNIEKQYVKWQLRYLQPRIIEEARSSTQNNLNAEIVRNLSIPLPPIREQHAIASYLDRETGRIDVLVTAKLRLLEMLAQKRFTIIFRTITRGLDHNVPTRDSGIPWIGKIPAHWETPPVYARFEVQLGKMLDEKRIKGTHLAPYLRNVDVQWGEINTSDLPEMDFDDEDRRRYSLREGDILVCEGGEIGRCAIWKGARVDCYYQKALHRLRPIGGKDLPEFFVHVMRAIVGADVFSSQSAAATIQHLPEEKLRIVRYPAPPINEQRDIVEYISRETSKIDAVRDATEKTITLLKERRSALITAIVTGQISIGESA